MRAALGRSRLPLVKNEPNLNYAPGSKERANLQKALQKMLKECPEVPCIVAGKEVRTGQVVQQVMPSNHKHALCTFHQADQKTVEAAVEASMAAKRKWEALPFEDRAAIFLKAADLLTTKYRAEICAAVMLGASKNVWQAEIDAPVETADFWRFGVSYVEELYRTQPPENSQFVWNRMEYRPLDGYVVAISPFNFAAIGANLPSSPAMVGNTVVWKPASTSLLGNYLTYKILEEAGLPPGVINFCPGDGPTFGRGAFHNPNFAGLHFTGSTYTFNIIWKIIADNISAYRSYPRIVGETGGKNFHFIHHSVKDLSSVVNHTIRAAFEYQGQKCSACSRLYIPDSLWLQFKELLVARVKEIKMGQPIDFSSFMCAVIDKKAFDSMRKYIEDAKKNPSCTIIAGGGTDDSTGYFVQPTVIEVKDPKYVTMREEIFGPVLSVYVYPQDKYEETLALCDQTSPYGLTGSIFADDRYALEFGVSALRNAAGNFYINDKCTGAVVGQQAFGGARASGTNDKSGAAMNFLRWVSARSIKENFLPLSDFRYPHMNPDA